MQVNELRIGNCVKSRVLGTFIKVDLHFFNEICDHENNGDDTMLDWYIGIQLTPEILINNCGFQKTHFGNFYRIDNGVFSPWLEYEDTFFDIIVGDPEYSIGQVKYIHQLQNLYLALTGKELGVNL